MRILKTVIFILLIAFGSIDTVFASTLTDQVPWGARNPYHAFDGTDWNAHFDVSFPSLGPGVDIYAGTGGTSSTGPYPADPTAYFTGFTQGQPITFKTTITNDSGIDGLDNFNLSISKVVSCPGYNIQSPDLTEKNLSDCSNAAGMSNQQQYAWLPNPTYHDPLCPNGINGKFCLTIAAGASADLSYDNAWTPTEPGYYQFDFGSDDYAYDFPGTNTYAAGFIRVNPRIKGNVKDSANNPIAGVIINQGVTNPLPAPGMECNIGTATTDSNGNYYIDVPTAKGFCLRPPALNGYEKAVIAVYGSTPNSYECQKAGGYYSPDDCGASPGKDLTSDNNYDFIYSSLLPPPPPNTKSCSINIISSSNGMTDGADIRITYSGYGSTTTAEPVRLWVEKKDGTAISPAPKSAGIAVPVVNSAGKNFYRLDSIGWIPPGVVQYSSTPDCAAATSPDGCSAIETINLPAGEYWLHCDLADHPASDIAKACSGNPFCTYNNSWSSTGTITCLDSTSQPFQSCSSSDHAILSVAANPPSITSLQIGNAGGSGQVIPPTFVGNSKTSGLTSDPGEGGSNWLNPMSIKLNVTPGSGNIKLYATAFYDKKQGQTSNQTALTSLTAIESQIDTDPIRGFLLAYSAQDCLNQTGNCYVDGKTVSNSNSSLTYFLTGRYYVYVKGSGWKDLKYYPTGYEVYDNSLPAKLLYKAYQLSNGSYFATWQMRLYKAFQSKSMYTPGFVIDSNNLTGFLTDL